MDEAGTRVEVRDDLLWMTYGDLTLHFYATPHLVVCEVGDVGPKAVSSVPCGSVPRPRA
ncbi:hypothetical protein BCF44_116170 [Kutzneria buriramensis]|uniref:Uncharacterized protein n=1 Tax=Kutzneria buriramensis TaxID=1045776 RepID=A0A3E0H0Z8_9PSEU|nr:hypothetical protein BCF44_116170 [Kutzneria buriramensis]